MRTIHSDLKTAQEALSSTPYVYIGINDSGGAGVVNYGTANASNPLLALEHREEPYRETATIVIDNSNRGLDPGTLDLRGQSFAIGYGYKDANSVNRYTGDGAGTAGMPTLWVKSQHVTSMEGKVVCILNCEGMWGILRELEYLPVGEEPYYDVDFGGTQTIKEIIILALAEADMTLNATVPDDGIIDTLMPFFSTNLSSYPSLGSLIYNNPDMLQATKCYLRPEADKVFKLIYPQETDPVNETYYSDQIPYFREYTEKYNLLIPNTIYVYWGADPNTEGWEEEPYFSNLADPASATDAASIAAYASGSFDGIVKRTYLAPRLSIKADGTNRAEAILARFKSEELAGRLVLPYHDCSVELYDRVKIYDSRGY